MLAFKANCFVNEAQAIDHFQLRGVLDQLRVSVNNPASSVPALSIVRLHISLSLLLWFEQLMYT